MLKLSDFKNCDYMVTRTGVMDASWATWLLQKCIYDDYKKKYYINVYVSDSRLWGFNTPWKRKFTVKCCFEKNDLTYWISVSRDKGFNSVDEIEDIVQELWEKQEMDYYAIS